MKPCPPSIKISPISTLLFKMEISNSALEKSAQTILPKNPFSKEKTQEGEGMIPEGGIRMIKEGKGEAKESLLD